MFDFSNITSANTTLQMIQFINVDWTGGSFAILLLLSLFVIVYMNMSFYSAPNALLATSFFMIVISGLMWMAGLLPLYVLIIAESVLFIAAFTSVIFEKG